MAPHTAVRSALSGLGVVLAVAVLLSGLTGCGGSDGGRPAAGRPVPGGPATAAPAPAAPPPTDAGRARPTPVTLKPGTTSLSKVPTTDKVVFLTIDDGDLRDPSWVEYVKNSGVPVTVFPRTPNVKDDPTFFKGLEQAGAVIENHTMTHPDFHKLDGARQQKEICGGAEQVQAVTGRRPVLFRPPYGNYTKATAAAEAACGAKYRVLWSAAINDGNLQFDSGHPPNLVPGEIILMHFRKTFREDFEAAVLKAAADGMTFGLLEDYLTPGDVPSGLPRPSGVPKPEPGKKPRVMMVCGNKPCPNQPG